MICLSRCYEPFGRNGAMRSHALLRLVAAMYEPGQWQWLATQRHGLFTAKRRAAVFMTVSHGQSSVALKGGWARAVE